MSVLASPEAAANSAFFSPAGKDELPRVPNSRPPSDGRAPCPQPGGAGTQRRAGVGLIFAKVVAFGLYRFIAADSGPKSRPPRRPPIFGLVSEHFRRTLMAWVQWLNSSTAHPPGPPTRAYSPPHFLPAIQTLRTSERTLSFAGSAPEPYEDKPDTARSTITSLYHGLRRWRRVGNSERSHERKMSDGY